MTNTHHIPPGNSISPGAQTQNLGLILDYFHFLTPCIQVISKTFQLCSKIASVPVHFSTSSLIHPNSKKHQFFFLFLKIYFIEVRLIYNVMLISTVQQSNSVILVYIYFFIFFSITVYHKTLNIVPWVIQ